MTFIARLSTPRTIERAVQFFGPSRAYLEVAAEKWLAAHGETGDVFEIVERREVVVGRVEK